MIQNRFIQKSRRPAPPTCEAKGGRRPRHAAAVLGVALGCLTSIALAGEETSPKERARRTYQEAHAQFRAQPSHYPSAWQFGRASFDWADLASGKAERRAIAEQGIEACEQAVRLSPRRPEGHYYLALNLGQLARTKTLGALGIVKRMEDSLQKAIEAGEEFDFAGPHRSLGMLYLEAPGWPASIGDGEKAVRHLEQSVALSPNYPANHLSLIEALWARRDRAKARSRMKEFAELLPKAKEQFSGERWELSWKEWDKQWDELQRKDLPDAR